MPDGDLPPAILLGGEIIAVSVARSLARSGVDVIALGAGSDPVRWSRYCREFVDVGTGSGDYLDWLTTHGPRRGVLVPCDDAGLEAIARGHATLEEEGYQRIESDPQVMAALLAKARTYELCREVGVAAPRAAVVRDTGGAEVAARDFEYPCALKPLSGHRFRQHFRGVKGVVVGDRKELMSAWERIGPLGLEMLVTEIIAGGDDQFRSYYSYLDGEGEPLFHFTKGKMRQWPTTFGLATYQFTTWDPDVAEIGLRFFKGVGLRGLGNVEFKRDARDGSWKLIECNARPTGANEQVRVAGLDLALLAYNRVVGRPDPPLDGYRTGVYLWHPYADTRAMLAYRREGRLTFRSWGRSLMRRQHFAMADARDPWPSLRFGVHKAARMARRAGAGGRS